MKLFLAKPDLTYFGQYNEMMAEWCESGTRIAPWFLDAPFPDMEAFARFVRMLDNCEHGITAEGYASTTSYARAVSAEAASNRTKQPVNTLLIRLPLLKSW